MRTKLLLLAGGCAFALAAPSFAQQGPPVEVVPGAPRSQTTITTWQGDPVIAQRMIVTHYKSVAPNVSVVDTGRVIQLQAAGTPGYWRIYETVYPDGSRKQVAIRMQTNNQYVLMESPDGSSWGQVIMLQE